MSYGLISADDHVVETPAIWRDRLPEHYREIGPRVVRRKIRSYDGQGSSFEFADDGEWADVWLYEDVAVANMLSSACAGWNTKDIGTQPVLFEDMRPGSFRADDRLSDMDINGVEASQCFPNMFVRFCGQRFLSGKDPDLALLCVRAYNDWMVEEWAGPSGGRLVPLCIVPLWDAELAAEEVERNAARGVRAVCFSELPGNLGLPSIHSGYWDRFIDVCADTGTVINLHIGSGSTFMRTTADAPTGVISLLTFVTPAMGMADWLLSGQLVRHPGLKIAFAECNIGWLPYVLERADNRWEEDRGFQPEFKLFDGPPSRYFASNMFCSFFNDRAGLAYIAGVGVKNNFGFDNLTFETDYPHSDGTWPESRQVADKIMEGLSEGAKRKLLRDNAARQLGLPT